MAFDLRTPGVGGGGGPSQVPTAAYFDYGCSDKNSNCSGSHNKMALTEFRPQSEHFYEQPMVVFAPNKSPADSLEKTPFFERTSNGSSAGTLRSVVDDNAMTHSSIVILYLGLNPESIVQ